MPRRPRFVAVALTLGVVVTVTAGCTHQGAPASRAGSSDAATGEVSSADLDASVTQYRFDEGTRRLRAGVVNASGRDITVTRATLAWDGLGFSTVRLPAEPVHPGQAAAFTLDYGTPRCTGAPRGRPQLVAVVDGRIRRLPLRVDVPGLLSRLRAAACARSALDRQVAVRLVMARRTAGAGDSEHLPATLVLTRPPVDARRAQVRVVAVRGSVLFDLTPSRHLPTTLRRAQDRLEVPLAVGSTLRCDGHARGQASQPFLFAAYLRVGADTTQRVVLLPSVGEQERLQAMLDRVCR